MGANTTSNNSTPGSNRPFNIKTVLPRQIFNSPHLQAILELPDVCTNKVRVWLRPAACANMTKDRGDTQCPLPLVRTGSWSYEPMPDCLTQSIVCAQLLSLKIILLQLFILTYSATIIVLLYTGTPVYTAYYCTNKYWRQCKSIWTSTAILISLNLLIHKL